MEKFHIMKKLLFICIITCGLQYSCDKQLNVPKKYYLEIKQNNWTDIVGDEYETKSEEIIANNIEEAYSKGYKSYMISKRVSQATNGDMARRDMMGFVVLDEYKKDISMKVSQKSKDSIHKKVDQETEYITEDLKNKIIDHQNKKAK